MNFRKRNELSLCDMKLEVTTMSNVTFFPFVPHGTVDAPPSKSDVHRAIICAALSRGVCTIAPVALSNDIRATIACVEALGATTKL